MRWLALAIMLLAVPAEAQMQRQMRGAGKKPPSATHYLLLQGGGKILLQGGGFLLCTGPC